MPEIRRAVFAGGTAAVIILGFLDFLRDGNRDPDRNFFLLLGIALLPSVIYAIGIKRRKSVLIYGVLLLGITALSWVWVFLPLGDTGGMEGVFTFPAFFVTLAAVLIGAARDHAASRRRRQ